MSQSARWQYQEQNRVMALAGAPREYTPEIQIVEHFPELKNSDQGQQLEQGSSVSYSARDTGTWRTSDTQMAYNGFAGYTPEGFYSTNAAGVPHMHPNQVDDANRMFDSHEKDYDTRIGNISGGSQSILPMATDLDELDCIPLRYFDRPDFESMLTKALAIIVEQDKQISQKDAQMEQLTRNVSTLNALVENQAHVVQERDQKIAAQARELGAAQAYITTADECSGSDVINLVQRLNEEILQLSSSLADLIEDLYTKRVRPLRIKASWTKAMPDESIRTLVRSTIGDDLLSFLTTQGPNVQRNSVIFQSAVQALLVGWAAHYYVGVFYPGLGAGDLFDQVFSCIKATEPPGISAKWRAITSRALMTLDGTKKDDRVTSLYTAITGLLTMAGWRSLTYASGKGSSNDQATVGLIKNSLCTIYDVATEIKATIEQRMPSCDIDLVIFHKSVKFNPTLMDSCTGGSTEDNTLCTVALGLTKRSIKQLGRGCGIYETVEQIILKPEVVLMSALRAE